MTKAEVRCLVLSQARLSRHHCIWDVGSGTGSVSVEAALLAPEGRVFAVERDPSATVLTRENLIRFHIKNATLVHDEAPGCLRELPPADRVILSGTGGRQREILAALCSLLDTPFRVVAVTVTADGAGRFLEAFEESGYRDIQATMVTIARSEPVGTVKLWRGLNPITIISAERGVRHEQPR